MGIVLSHGELGLGFVLPDEDRCGAMFFQTGTGEAERSEDIFSFDSGTLPHCFSARGIHVQPLVYTDLLHHWSFLLQKSTQHPYCPFF